MPREHVGDPLEIETADHPPRSDALEDKASREHLIRDYGGGWFICDGPIHLTPPEVGDAYGLADHHGGGIYVKFGDRPVLVALSTLQMEWSEGWGADAKVVAGMVANNNVLRKRLD